ncbi:hypothetical protein STVIR_6209 [Streptomyces viridochromogenes Tue57]|uniref:Uncharacterized protein n=1 Tax=Streptomyces viridochromogenes Tue57 TaxID=1160705 RepID=L8P5K2_STRVR|nr:hypothetical protein STVIR_6209 [Streptomyces viridochromogenes Tue57]
MGLGPHGRAIVLLGGSMVAVYVRTYAGRGR